MHFHTPFTLPLRQLPVDLRVVLANEKLQLLKMSLKNWFL